MQYLIKNRNRAALSSNKEKTTIAAVGKQRFNSTASRGLTPVTKRALQTHTVSNKQMIWRSAAKALHEEVKDKDPKMKNLKSTAHKYGQNILYKEFGTEYGSKEKWEGLEVTEAIVRRNQRHELGIGRIVQNIDT